MRPGRGVAWFVKVSVVFLLLASLAGCEEDPDEARFKLGQLGYQFNTHSLARSIAANDHVAVRYLILAGMDPDSELGRPEIFPLIEEEFRGSVDLDQDPFMVLRGLMLLEKSRFTALCFAIIGSHLKIVEVLLDAGADPEKVSLNGQNALSCAVAMNRPEAVELLLDHDASQAPDEDGNTPVMLAVQRDDVVLLEVLLDAGGDLTVVNNVGLSVLAQAVSVKVVEMLLDAGIDVNVHFPDIEDGDGLTPLMAATQAGNLAVVRRLLDAGADPNLHSRNGDTALMMAVSKRNPSEDDDAIVQALLQSGADPDPRNNDGVTPLGFAISASNLEIVGMLLEAGADASLADNDGVTPLIRLLADVWVMEEDEMLALVTDLLEAGADPNSQSAEGVSAVALAVARDLFSIAQKLFEAGAEPRGRNSNGDPFFERIVRRSVDLEFLQLAIDALIDTSVLDAQNHQGGTALIEATTQGRADTVRLLLGAGADPNVANDGGAPALMYAASGKKLDIVRILLEAGADPNARNNEGTTVLMWAATANVDIVRAVLEAGADPETRTEDGKTAIDFPRWPPRGVVAAIREAIAKKQAAEAAEVRDAPAQTGSPSTTADVSTDLVQDAEGTLERLTDEKYIGGAKSRGLKMYALSSDGNWCAEAVVFKFVAASATVYSDGTVNFFMKRFGERINEAQFCPAARSARLYGYTEAGSDPVFTGTASAAGGWSVN